MTLFRKNFGWVSLVFVLVVIIVFLAGLVVMEYPHRVVPYPVPKLLLASHSRLPLVTQPSEMVIYRPGEEGFMPDIALYDLYFTITGDCQEMYFSSGENDSQPTIHRYDFASQKEYAIRLDGFPKGTVYAEQLDPSDTLVAALDTYQRDGAQINEGRDRGVILMQVSPNLGAPRFLYGDTPGSDVWEFAWSKDGQSIAVAEPLQNNQDVMVYTDVRLDGLRTPITEQQWLANYRHQQVKPIGNPEGRNYHLVDPNQVFSVDYKAGEYSIDSETVVCNGANPLI